MIDINLLLAWGASSKKYEKGTCIFMEGDMPRYYFQIQEGEVEMFNTSNEGKIFTQGIFHSGQSFGEPPMFIAETYPATAIAVADTILFRLPVDTFMQLLSEYRGLEREFLKLLAQRIYHKAIVARGVANCTPEERLCSLLAHLKKYHYQGLKETYIPLTRQQLANLCGLRVETVIRTLSSMNKKGLLQIKNHKLYV